MRPQRIGLIIVLTLTIVALVHANRDPQYALLVLITDTFIQTFESIALELQNAFISSKVDPLKKEFTVLRDTGLFTHKASQELMETYVSEGNAKDPTFRKTYDTRRLKRSFDALGQKCITVTQPKATWDLHNFLFAAALDKLPDAPLETQYAALRAKVPELLKSPTQNAKAIIQAIQDFWSTMGSTRGTYMESVFGKQFTMMEQRYREKSPHIDFEAEDDSGESSSIVVSPRPAPKPTSKTGSSTGLIGSSSTASTIASSSGSGESTQTPGSAADSLGSSDGRSPKGGERTNSTTTTTTTESSSRREEARDSSGNVVGGPSSVNATVIAAIIAAAVVVCALIIWAAVRARQRSRREMDDKDVSTTELGTTELSTEHTEDTYTGFVASEVWQDPLILSRWIPTEKVEFGPVIGRGGFGRVYVGRFNNRKVAIKQLLPEYASNMEHIDKFGAEIKLMCSLDHVRIVRVIGVTWNSLSDACVLTEYMSGGDLRSVVERFERRGHPHGFDKGKIKIALHIAHALGYLHSLQPAVLHRDLKSRNVLLTDDYGAKLTDFGVARDMVDQTMTGGVGSSLWMAPEVILGQRYDEKADVFSFGVVLSELDSHALPYADVMATRTGHGAVWEAGLLQMVASGTVGVGFSGVGDADFVALAQACVSTNPEDRPSTVEVLHRVNQAWKRTGGIV